MKSLEQKLERHGMVATGSHSFEIVIWPCPHAASPSIRRWRRFRIRLSVSFLQLAETPSRKQSGWPSGLSIYARPFEQKRTNTKELHMPPEKNELRQCFAAASVPGNTDQNRRIPISCWRNSESAAGAYVTSFVTELYPMCGLEARTG